MSAAGRILLLGAGGQLGQRLQILYQRGALLRGMELKAVRHKELDICDESAMEAALNASRPDVVINAAAYTAVDLAETERARAMAVNAEAVGALARACASRAVSLVHISTDFVFGAGHSRPISRVTTPQPLNVYGESKLKGELRASEAMPYGLAILRTSWLYTAFGANFVTTMLRLMNERAELRVVCDQIGAPTACTTLCAAIDVVVRQRLEGLLHVCDAGVASWYDFACAIEEIGAARGLIDTRTEVLPIPSTAYPQAAQRPSFSLLESASSYADLNLRARHWRQALDEELMSGR